MGRHRKPNNPTASRRGALSAAAVTAVLAGGFQIAAPGAAQAESVDSAAVRSVIADARAMLEDAAATGGAPSAASVAEMLGRSAGSAGSMLPEALGSAQAVLGSSRAVAPIPGRVTSEYGPRWGTAHAGVDIAGDMGDPILAAADGTVVEAGPAAGFGRWVRLAHDDGTSTIYGHIHEALVGEGQRVGAGQVIATVGNRGDSTGPHLHFETWDAAGNTIDPVGWLAQRGAALGLGPAASGSLGSGSVGSGSLGSGSLDSGSVEVGSLESGSLGARP